MEGCDLYHGDWLELAANMQDASVDAIICDPPYGTTALKWDTAPDLKRMFAEFKRLAKPHAPMAIFSAQPFTTDLINAGRGVFRYALVWPKTTTTGYLNANRRPLTAHEDVLIFSRAGIATYNPQKVMSDKKPYSVIRRAKSPHYGAQTATTKTVSNGERFPTTVLKEIAGQQANSLHPTQKPLDLLVYLVKTYSNPNDLIFDPFSGSGTTAHACLLTGRRFVGAELDTGYYQAAVRRLEAVKAQPRLLEVAG